MRLICPNCDAQYEVDDSVIPEGGRDVQCSSCGHSWFQVSKAALAAAQFEPLETARDWDADEDDLIGWEEEDPAIAGRELPKVDDWNELEASAEQVVEEVTADLDAEPLDETGHTITEPPPEQIETATTDEPPAETAPPEAPTEPADAVDAVIAEMMRGSGLAQADSDYAEDSDYEEGLTPAPVAGATPRKPVDDGLLSILREEAEREAEQRRAEGLSLDPQPELGLAAPVATATSAQKNGWDEDADRFADFTEDEVEFDDEGVLRSRGVERLPDVEEINSTLTATSDRDDDFDGYIPEEPGVRRSGFGRGFSMIILLAAAGLLVYVFAARLITAIPTLEEPVTQFVTAVDAGRLWLDQQMQVVIDKLQPEAGS